MIRPSLVQSPRIRGPIIGLESIRFVGWDAARPSVTVECCGVNDRQAIDDAALKLRVPGWRVRVRPAPERTIIIHDELPSLGIA